jgi:nucleoside-diphosphate-sugar epimerase
VTGGSGFIGGRLLERLARDGWTVRALARSDAAARTVEARGADAVRGDLDDIELVTAGAQGCEVAFHAAALVTEWASDSQYDQANTSSASSSGD